MGAHAASARHCQVPSPPVPPALPVGEAAGATAASQQTALPRRQFPQHPKTSTCTNIWMDTYIYIYINPHKNRKKKGQVHAGPRGRSSMESGAGGEGPASLPFTPLPRGRRLLLPAVVLLLCASRGVGTCHCHPQGHSRAAWRDSKGRTDLLSFSRHLWFRLTGLNCTLIIATDLVPLTHTRRAGGHRGERREQH